MRRLLPAALVAVASLPAHAAAPAWSFASPLGGFDLGAAQRGFGLYEQSCASCHAMAALSPADLLALGFDRKTALDTLHALGHPPFTGGASGPDISRFERVAGVDATWTLVHAGDYNTLPPGHKVLANSDQARDLVTFLAWAAHPHQTRRRQVGIAILLFGGLAIGIALRAARSRSRHG